MRFFINASKVSLYPYTGKPIWSNAHFRVLNTENKLAKNRQVG
ncbi:hypothetical protein [Spirosoma jeollabukense]